MLTGKVCLATGASGDAGKGITLESWKGFYASEHANHYDVKDENGFERPSCRAFIGDPPCYSCAVVEYTQ